MINKKIKIAYFIDSINKIAGTEKQLLHLINHIDRKRFEPYLFSLRKPSGIFSHKDLDAHYCEIGIKSLFKIKTIRKILNTAKLLNDFQIDIVQTFFIDANIVGVISGLLSKTKVIIGSRRDMGFWHTKKILVIFRLLNKFCRAFIVNSNAIKEFIIDKERISPKKIEVIYNGVDVESFTSQLKHEAQSVKKIVYKKSSISMLTGLSMINPPLESFQTDQNYTVGITANFTRKVKRVDLFIIAARQVLNRMPNVTFYIVGDGHLKNRLVKLAEDLGVSDKIIFTGSRTDIPNIIAQWDVGVLTSDSEGLSNSIIEYMLSGLPVVATDVGGNRELVENGVNGFLVPSGNPYYLAEKIFLLLLDREVRRKMGNRNREKAIKMFSWKNIMTKTEEFYTNILDNT